MYQESPWPAQLQALPATALVVGSMQQQQQQQQQFPRLAQPQQGLAGSPGASKGRASAPASTLASPQLVFSPISLGTSDGSLPGALDDGAVPTGGVYAWAGAGAGAGSGSGAGARWSEADAAGAAGGGAAAWVELPGAKEDMATTRVPALDAVRQGRRGPTAVAHSVRALQLRLRNTDRAQQGMSPVSAAMLLPPAGGGGAGGGSGISSAGRRTRPMAVVPGMEGGGPGPAAAGGASASATPGGPGVPSSSPSIPSSGATSGRASMTGGPAGGFGASPRVSRSPSIHGVTQPVTSRQVIREPKPPSTAPAAGQAGLQGPAQSPPNQQLGPGGSGVTSRPSSVQLPVRPANSGMQQVQLQLQLPPAGLQHQQQGGPGTASISGMLARGELAYNSPRVGATARAARAASSSSGAASAAAANPGNPGASAGPGPDLGFSLLPPVLSQPLSAAPAGCSAYGALGTTQGMAQGQGPSSLQASPRSSQVGAWAAGSGPAAVLQQAAAAASSRRSLQSYPPVGSFNSSSSTTRSFGQSASWKGPDTGAAAAAGGGAAGDMPAGVLLFRPGCPLHDPCGGGGSASGLDGPRKPRMRKLWAQENGEEDVAEGGEDSSSSGYPSPGSAPRNRGPLVCTCKAGVGSLGAGTCGGLLRERSVDGPGLAQATPNAGQAAGGGPGGGAKGSAARGGGGAKEAGNSKPVWRAGGGSGPTTTAMPGPAGGRKAVQGPVAAALAAGGGVGSRDALFFASSQVLTDLQDR